MTVPSIALVSWHVLYLTGADPELVSRGSPCRAPPSPRFQLCIINTSR